MPQTVLTDLTKMKTGDLIDAIHDVVCGMGADGAPVPEAELQELFNLVDELRRRSIRESAKRSQGPRKLDS